MAKKRKHQRQASENQPRNPHQREAGPKRGAANPANQPRRFRENEEREARR